MKRIVLAVLLGAPISGAFAQSLNPQVTQANIKSTICVSGWTATVRPPVSYTNKIKYDLMKAQGIPISKSREYELDHTINIGIGGHPRNPKNLRLQAWNGPDGAHAKDVVEAHMQRMVCAGKISLAKAQACMWNDWKSCPK